MIAATVLICLHGFRRFGRAGDNAEAAERVLDVLARRRFDDAEELRAVVARAGAEWAAALDEDDDYYVAFGPVGGRWEAVLRRRFESEEIVGTTPAWTVIAPGRPQSTALCLQGPPLVRTFVDVAVRQTTYLVEFTNFAR